MVTLQKMTSDAVRLRAGGEQVAGPTYDAVAEMAAAIGARAPSLATPDGAAGNEAGGSASQTPTPEVTTSGSMHNDDGEVVPESTE